MKANLFFTAKVAELNFEVVDQENSCIINICYGLMA